MTKSVKPIQSTTYDLQPASNPIYFENGTDLTVSGGAGVFGASGTTWMVTNAGTIASTNLSREGAIQVVGAGDVTNDASGVVTASGSYARAVYLGGDGQITNAGLLAGYGTHVQGILTKGNVTATNTGTIKVETGSGQAHASGVNLQDGGSFTNEVGGAVYAYGYHVAGVQAYLTGSVTNYGSITAKTNASGHAAAVQLDANGTLVNEVGGKISASGTHALGVEMLSGGTTTNYGSISAASGGARYATGVQLENGGDFYNKSTGTVTTTGSYISGVYASGGGGVYNDGSISLTGRDGTAVHFQSAGTIVNTGSISATGGYVSAVYASAAAAVTLTNSGTITATATSGMYGADGVDFLKGGYVDNESAGAITANGAYVNGVADAAGGQIVNDGAISVSGSHASAVYFTGAGEITNSGSISATGAYVSAIFATAAITVTNTGTITAQNTSGQISAVGVNLGGGGDVYNKSAGSITASGHYISGIFAAAAANVYNYGSIGVSGNHVSAVNVSGAGAIDNTGTISSSAHIYRAYTTRNRRSR
jgi:fibronectin-binding autotransporter adhesin